MTELLIVAGAGASVDATFAESRTRNPGSSRGPPGSPKLMLVLLTGGPGPETGGEDTCPTDGAGGTLEGASADTDAGIAGGPLALASG